MMVGYRFKENVTLRRKYMYANYINEVYIVVLLILSTAIQA